MAKAKEKKTKRLPYSSISIPTRTLVEVEKLVREMGYWPTMIASIREACLEKLEKHRKDLGARRLAEEAVRARVT